MKESNAEFLARMKNEWLSQIGVIEFTNSDAHRLIELAEADVLLRQARLCLDPYRDPDMAEEIDDYLKGVGA